MGSGSNFSGLPGLLGAALLVGLYFVSRAFFPSLSTAILIIGVVVLLLILAVVGVVLFFAFRKPKQDPGVPAQDTTEKVIRCLGDIRTAMDQLYTNLFTDDILDLTVEMEVLTQVCKQNGLLADESFHLQEGGRDITLTL